MKHLHNLFKTLFYLFTTIIFLSSLANAVTYTMSNDDSDAEQRANGSMSLGSSDLEMAYDPGGDPDRGLQIIGLRFNAVDIPQGASITSARIRFRADTDDDGETSLIISGESVDDASSFSSDNSELSSRLNANGTNAEVNWNPAEWENDEYYYSDDISPVVQEIVNRTGYAEDDLVIFIRPGAGCTDSECRRRADSRNESDSNAPRLEVEYTLPPSCATLRDSDDFTDTHTSYTTPVYNDSNWNVGPNATAMSRAYRFTVDRAGIVDIDLSRIDRDMARFSVSTNGCPVTLDGLTTSQLSFTGAGEFYVYIYYFDNGQGNTNIEHQLDVVFTPSLEANANNDNYSTLINTPLNNNVLQNDSGVGSFTVTGHTTPANGGLTIQTNGNFTYTPASGYSGSDSFTYQITDASNNIDTATVTITITNPDAANAVNDSYSVFTDTALSGNVISNDIGTNISVTANTNPANGTLTLTRFGDFEYRSAAGFAGTDTFEYTITDIVGDTDTATVSITVSNDTNYTSGSEFPFTLINPPFTRNLVGNYALAGNTIMCLTEKTDGYGGTCQDNDAIRLETSNRRVSKYIDIDEVTSPSEDASTWNSSSSYIVFPDTFDRSKRSRVKWAGLFWQGRISTDNDHPIRFGVEDGNAYNFTNTGEGYNYNLNINNTDANKIKLKVDNANYSDIQASNVFTYSSSGGTTYAAFADVTSLLQGADLDSGKHVFTAANLTTAEGREPSPGVFGGWSLVVIYNETTDGKLRNISIYNGFVSIDENNDPIEISGFKLPSDTSEDVTSQLAVFSGEGEYRYGRRSGSNDTDYMKMSNRNNGGWLDMPGATNPNNIFDAVINGVDRDNVAGHSNNLQINNDGIDVDLFDTTTLMTPWRNANPDMSEVFISLYSDNDYITPSMVAFSAELYKPNVCYDYVVKRDDFTIPSGGLDINATFETGETLSIITAIKSLESDVDLTLSAVGIDMTQRVGHITFDPTEAYYSLANTNILLPTPVTNNSTQARPEIAVGKNRNELIGGTVGPFERYFAEFNYIVTDVNNSRFEADFTIELNTTIDYGSGPITQVLPLEQCVQSLTYNPTWLQFNVERDFTPTTATSDTDRYSLYTQIAGRDFDYSVAAYTQDSNDEYTIETTTDDMTVDVELIDAAAFDDNTSFLKCSNPDPSIILNKFGKGTFVHFNNTSRVHVNETDFDLTRAVKNTVFRMWILTDENNTIIPHSYERYQGDKFKEIYDENIVNLDEPGLCAVDCGVQGVANSESCYNCLRNNFAKPICSRDNFAIRPESYRVNVYDAGEIGDLDTAKVPILKNDETSSSPKNKETLVAKYGYLMQAFSTKDTGDVLATGYYNDTFQSDQLATYTDDGTDDISLIEFIDDAVQCNDLNHTSLNIDFANGAIRDFNLANHNVGKYTLWIKDNSWTKVDQAQNNKYKTRFDDGCYLSSAPECNDCVYNNSQSDINSDIGRYGCQISTDLPNDNTYTDINITYMPDHFSLSEIAVRKKPLFSTNTNTLYISDLSTDLSMAVSFEGNITALGYNDSDGDTPLSNFTEGCAANGIDILLDINKTILTGPTISTDINNIENPVNFQQALLEYYTIPDATQTLDESDTNQSMTLSFENFEKNRMGKAHVDLYYNFKKPTNAVVNPIDVNFTNLHASAPDANATAYATANTMHYNTPEGDRTGDNYTYYYAKVEPGQFFIDDIKEDFVMTALYVQIYCFDANVSFCPSLGLGGVSNPDYPTAPNETQWYSASGHDGITDGKINTLTAIAGTGTVSPSTNLRFTNGARTDIRVNYTGNTRPGTVTVRVDLDPWLFYSPTLANLEYSVRFTADGNWAGIGNTGNVLKTLPSNKENNRVDW